MSTNSSPQKRRRKTVVVIADQADQGIQGNQQNISGKLHGPAVGGNVEQFGDRITNINYPFTNYPFKLMVGLLVLGVILILVLVFRLNSTTVRLDDIERSLSPSEGFNNPQSYTSNSGANTLRSLVSPVEKFGQMMTIVPGEKVNREANYELPYWALPYWARDEGLSPDPNNFGYTKGADQYRGDSQAPITVIEFSDLQDPHNQRHYLETQPYLDQDFVNQVKVRWVFKHFPIKSKHPQAFAAAVATECAAQQSEFWNMYNRLQADVSIWSIESPNPIFIEIARSLGLDDVQFSICLRGFWAVEQVNQDLMDGALFVQAVPTFIIIANGEGRLIPGTLPKNQFVAELKNAFDMRSETKK